MRIALGIGEWDVGIVYLCTNKYKKLGLLTVEPNIMVGKDSWLVALGSPADHHMQHPIRGFNVMFLQQQEKAISANSLRARPDFSL